MVEPHTKIKCMVPAPPTSNEGMVATLVVDVAGQADERDFEYAEESRENGRRARMSTSPSASSHEAGGEAPGRSVDFREDRHEGEGSEIARRLVLTKAVEADGSGPSTSGFVDARPHG